MSTREVGSHRIADVEQMGVILERHRCQGNLALTLDIDLLGAVDHDVCNAVVREQRLERAEAHHVVDELVDEVRLFGPVELDAMLGKQLSGTLTSPCDCVVARQLVDDGQYASKGAVIFQLIPRTTNPIIEARFSYRQFDEVTPGTRVNFQVAGEDEVRTGQIVSSASLNSDDLASDIRVQIKPDSGLPAELAGRPAAVNSDRGPSLNWLIDKAVARGL